MKQQIPNKIKIGRITYKILIVPNVKKGLIGFTNYETRTIFIKDNKEKFNTFFHELAHILISEVALNFRDTKEFKDLLKLKTNELFIESLGKKLKGLIK